jgi:glycine reductase
VAYVFAVLSTKHEPIPGEPVLYGSNIDRALPTVIHPNEVLDGAVLSPYRASGFETYVIQNHPIIKELYRRHGKDLCFTGVIITTAPDSEYEYERAATVVANMAKRVLGADGVVLNKAGMGAEEIVPARMAERCEALGIRRPLMPCFFMAQIRATAARARTPCSTCEVWMPSSTWARRI